MTIFPVGAKLFQVDGMKVVVAFHNVVNTPKNSTYL
jgi:hypothetical protein